MFGLGKEGRGEGRRSKNKKNWKKFERGVVGEANPHKYSTFRDATFVIISMVKNCFCSLGEGGRVREGDRKEKEGEKKYFLMVTFRKRRGGIFGDFFCSF